MKVLVATEARFFRSSSGAYQAPTQGRGYSFWTRYLSAFDEVGILARVSDASGVGGPDVEGPGVRVLPVTDFVGAVGLARRGQLARRDVRHWADDHPGAAIVARLPGVLGGMLAAYAVRRPRPYAIEVVGDPLSAVATAGVAGAGSGALAVLASLQMRHHVRRASAVAYVTRDTLQRRYPPPPAGVTAAYSSVELPDEAYRPPREPAAGRPQLVMVGTMSQPYKGHDVLLQALAELNQRGVVTRTSFVGDGQLRPSIEQQAQRMGLDATFYGQLTSPDEVRRVLDTADLFVMPSLSEGLPRALIEAMARGLPAVASRVGGIPELLDHQSMVPPGAPTALADKINQLISDPELWRREAHRNYSVSRRYHSDILAQARAAFYTAVREAAAE